MFIPSATFLALTSIVKIQLIVDMILNVNMKKWTHFDWKYY